MIASIAEELFLWKFPQGLISLRAVTSLGMILPNIMLYGMVSCYKRPCYITKHHIV